MRGVPDVRGRVVEAGRGMRAYAYNQADMYKEKRAKFEAEYDGARRKDVDSERLDHMRVSALPVIWTIGH